MRPSRSRARAVVGLAAAQARYYRWRVLLAVLGVALAVVLVTLLAGLGHGVTSQGTAALDATNRDLWLSAPVQLAPATVGAVENRLVDAHATARDVRTMPGVREAEALGFQAVYVSPDGSEFTTVVGVGVTGTSAPIHLLEGEGFDRRDVHYADGSYDGPMTRAVIIDERLAAQHGLEVGDALHVGGTLATAREHRFEIVGISPTFSSFVGATTVTLHLSELQTLTGDTQSDPASLIAITLEPGADPDAVASELEAAYPTYEVRTNEAQFRAVVGRQAPVLASTIGVVIVGVAAGITLVVNLLTRLVYAQQAELMALHAAGVSSRTLAAIAGAHGVLIGVAGTSLGLAATPILAQSLNQVVTGVVGYTSLIHVPLWVSIVGTVVGIGIGAVGAAVAGWHVGRLDHSGRLSRP